MMQSEQTLVLAIDGGGTHCRFALDDGATRHLIEAGSANAFSDFQGTVTCIQEGLDRLAHAANISRQTLNACPAFVGLAGVISPQIAKRLGAALPLQNAHFADDRPAALRGALGPKNGVLAHAGTGSFFGSQSDGTQRLAGGWGMTLGDEASAQWVGRMALSLTLQVTDGFLDSSALTQALLAKFDDTAGILDFTSHATPDAFGALAPVVTGHAKENDVLAQQIMQKGATYISNGLDHMGWTAGTPICLTGGIGPLYAPYLPYPKQSDIEQPLASPLDGAIALAHDRCAETANAHD